MLWQHRGVEEVTWECEDTMLTCRKRDVYICMPMCVSACVAPSNIVYLWYGYRSTGIGVVEYRD